MMRWLKRAAIVGVVASSWACSSRTGWPGRWCATRARRGRWRCRCSASSVRRCARHSASRARAIDARGHRHLRAPRHAGRRRCRRDGRAHRHHRSPRRQHRVGRRQAVDALLLRAPRSLPPWAARRRARRGAASSSAASATPATRARRRRTCTSACIRRRARSGPWIRRRCSSSGRRRRSDCVADEEHVAGVRAARRPRRCARGSRAPRDRRAGRRAGGSAPPGRGSSQAG